jgi:hypothetical protein
MSWLNRIYLFVNAITFCAVFWLFVNPATAALRPGTWEYKDLIAVLLSVVAIIVTFIGLFVAVGAIWGYQAIRGIAEHRAEEAAISSSQIHLGSEAFKADLLIAIREQMENEVRGMVQTAISGQRSDPVAASVPQQGDQQWRD